MPSPVEPNDPNRVGEVVLVGAGPGDPGLLTRRGAEALARAEVILYDHLVHPALLDLAPRSAERIFAGKSSGKCAMKQPEINERLVALARSGLRVVRLKGGDPYVFGRGAEEAEYLGAHGIPFRVVPGVTAGVGATAYAGIPITHRDSASAVAFVTAHEAPGSSESRLDWSALARFPGTLVVYMGVGRLRSLCDRLVREGRSAETPAALVHSGSLATQKTIGGTLADLADLVESASIGPPALVVIGEAVGHRPGLAWFEKLPLFGRRIVVTRPREEAIEAAIALEAMGAEPLIAPTVEILPADDPGPIDAAIERLSGFDWVVFTSANGVRAFLDRIEAIGKDARCFGPARIAAIGPATAETLGKYRLRADFVPESHRSEGLADGLIDRVRGGSVLLPRADRGRAVLVERLAEVARVEQIVAYRNSDARSLPPEVEARIEAATVDWVTITSPAIVERLYALLSEQARARIGREVRLASISPLTSAAANRLGWEVAAEAAEASWAGVVRAIAAFSG